MNDHRPTTNDESVARCVVNCRWSVVVGALVLLALAILIPAVGRAHEQPPNRAGVVIRHGDGRVVTACVDFAEPEISGTDLLERAGIPYVAQQSSLGAAVCQVDGEGCAFPTEDCFCKCKGADCIYWVYHHLTDGAWNYAQISASKSAIRPGDVDGWAWGPGTNQGGAQPPALSFGEICPAPGAEASPIPPTEPQPPPPSETSEPPTVAPPPPSATNAPPTVAPTQAPATVTSVAAGATASATPVPTSAPTPSATRMPSTTETSTTAPPTAPAQPTPTRASAGGAVVTPVPSAGGRSSTSYLAFGALALLLGAGIVVVLLRRRME